jgi:putative SOS response-associated peptidase YedK
MCGRFTLTKSVKELEKRFQAKAGFTELPRRFNIAPTDYAPVITQEEPGKIHLFRWGLIPPWAKDLSLGYKMINARIETLFEKPSFRKSILKKRCLVLSDGFYEWKRHQKEKTPFRIISQEEKLMAFGGIYEEFQDKDSGQIIFSFSIITQPSNNKLSVLHDRMPFILESNFENQWLDNRQDEKDIQGMMKPIPDEKVFFYQVDARVNHASQEDIALLKALGPLV